MNSATVRRIQRVLEGAVLFAALATIPLTIAQFQGAAGPAVLVADWLVWSVFVIDYFSTVALSSDRWRAARENWLTLAIIVLSFPALPAFLALTRLGRLVRVVRLFRLLRLVLVAMRGVQALRRALGHRGFVYVAAVTALLIIAGGTLISLVEPDVVGGGFWSGIWWAIVTTTTVGYGDIAPSSVGGRLIAVSLMLAGIGLVATMAASVAAYFVGKQEEEASGAELHEIKGRLERIERLLEQREERSDLDVSR